MTKLLYICEHLSTGGMPQYTLKQIESFNKDYDVYVIEVYNFTDEFVVQRNKIKKLSKHTCLEWNKGIPSTHDTNQIMSEINRIDPDIIHFQEIPQNFLNNDICKAIFNINRRYNIVVTTHSSLAAPHKILYLPDRFVLVNKWSQQIFQEYFNNIECEIWEYPIESYDYLHEPLDNTCFNVLNVGLFTEGKNQGEIFEVARQMLGENIKFHFVGNQAGNFSDYWGPLMKNKPDNCIIWGEREDTDSFYRGADLFYFSSKFELNPLVIKEALSYRLPVLMRKLPTYLDDYDDNPYVTYIDSNINKTKQIIRGHLQKFKEANR